MTNSDKKYLECLKEKIVATMQETYPGIPYSIAEWKGQNIIDFQSDLEFRLKQHLSEKWFYTHMKSESAKLPRIDVLNFLSEYVGCRNWEDFKHSCSTKYPNTQKPKNGWSFYLVPIFVVLLFTISYFIYKSFYLQEYNFCFYDSITKQPVTNGIIEITLHEQKESHRNYLCNGNGCFSMKTNKRKVKFIVETPYYRKDTIVRRLNTFNRSEDIKLRIDDYAIMIHYFSNSNVEDWLKRREDLNRIFSDNAKIFQVYDGTVGMEIYNKWEFINKLTLPTRGLRNIEILDTKYNGECISHLRFKQNNNID